MKEVKPRTARHYGAVCSPSYGHSETWLEPEEFAYPNGGFTRRARCRLRRNKNNPIVLAYGENRVVSCSTPDSFFTIPARLRLREFTVRGYISVSEGVYEFTPNATLVSPQTCVASTDDKGKTTWCSVDGTPDPGMLVNKTTCGFVVHTKGATVADRSTLFEERVPSCQRCLMVLEAAERKKLKKDR